MRFVLRPDRPAAAGVLLLAAVGSCRSEIEGRSVQVNVSSKCSPPSPSSSATFLPGGDFPHASLALRLDATGSALAIPAGTRALEVDVGLPQPNFLGVTNMPAGGTVNVLLWPAGESCALSDSVTFEAGEALGLVDSQHALIVPVTNPPKLIDLSTGLVGRMAQNLTRARVGATVTAFGDGALIAGGHPPCANGTGSPGGACAEDLEFAEVYHSGPNGTLGTLGTEYVLLANARAFHGATVLPSGETLLIDGAQSVGPPLGTIEALSTSYTSHTVGPTLTPRENPMVLRLPDGSIVIGGGDDASLGEGAGVGIRRIEWLSSPDPSNPTDLKLTGCADLPTGADTYLVAPTEGSAVLAVLVGGPASATNVYLVTPCDPASCDACSLVPGQAITAKPPAVGSRLLPGSGGRPLLWTGSTWMQWQPWSSAFDDLNVSEGPVAASPVAAPDPGLAMWIFADGTVRGLRVAARGAFTTESTIDSTNTAPDLESGSTADASWQSSTLHLANGAGAFLTDATFTHVVTTSNMTTECSVVLRDAFGGEFDVDLGPEPSTGPKPNTCSIGLPTSSDTPTVSVEVVGTTVSFSLNGSDEAPCPTPLPLTGRVSLGWRAPRGGTCEVRPTSLSR